MIIFDCDGVLINSEPIANRVVAASLTEHGWPLSATESHRLFLGMSLSDMKPLIEKQIGRNLPGDWVGSLAEQLVATMADKDATLTIRADAAARYETFDRVLATVKRAGVTRLGFVGNDQFKGVF